MDTTLGVCVCLLSLAIAESSQAVWEFGTDIPHTAVVAHHKGEIGILEKSKYIHFHVPPCHRVTYVRVEVENLLSNPAVNFNKNTNTVHISYKLLQSSLSTYDVSVKAKRLRGCSNFNNDYGDYGGGGGTIYDYEYDYYPPKPKRPQGHNKKPYYKENRPSNSKCRLEYDSAAGEC